MEPNAQRPTATAGVLGVLLDPHHSPDRRPHGRRSAPWSTARSPSEHPPQFGGRPSARSWRCRQPSHLGGARRCGVALGFMRKRSLHPAAASNRRRLRARGNGDNERAGSNGKQHEHRTTVAPRHHGRSAIARPGRVADRSSRRDQPNRPAAGDRANQCCMRPRDSRSVTAPGPTRAAADSARASERGPRPRKHPTARSLLPPGRRSAAARRHRRRRRPPTWTTPLPSSRARPPQRPPPSRRHRSKRGLRDDDP